MGIVDGFALGVVFAVDGGPLAGVLRRGQPQPEAEEVFQAGIELERAMGRITVQIDSDPNNGHVGHQQRDCHQLPGGQIKKTVVPHRLYGPQIK
jgi:hypothetical protein